MVSGSTPSHRRKTVSLWLWLVLFVVVIAGLGMKLSWDLAFADHEAAEQQAMQAFEINGDKRYREIVDILSGSYQKTKKQIEQSLGIQQPLSIKVQGSKRETSWIDPNYAVRVELWFDADDKLVGHSAAWGSGAYQGTSYKDPPLQRAFEWLGKMMCPVLGGIFTPLVYVVWVPLLIAYIKKPHRRGLLSFLLVSWAVLCPLVWLMSSYSLLSFKAMSSYDANGWGLIMFFVTTIFVALGGVRDWFEDPLACQNCGYSLRGNTTGHCPECGANISARQQRFIELKRS